MIFTYNGSKLEKLTDVTEI